MCGIIGLYSPDGDDHRRVERMTELLRHRGPDASGLSTDGLVSLGHRRLSIIDLSEAGRQPMTNEDGNLTLVANGEIYNYRDLRQDLTARGHVFRSGSDSEVLLHLYEEYGTELLSHVNGMFAFALWDHRTRRLLAAVDRFGKKPLYWAERNGRLALASEMKALLELPWVDRTLDYGAIDRYLTFRHIPAPATVYRGVRKLEPGRLMVYAEGHHSIVTYWRPTYSGTSATIETATDAVAGLLSDAVDIRLNADVPLGVYLSGGIDSATVAGLMADRHPAQKVAYSVSFDYAYDERARAEAFARHLGFQFNVVEVHPDDFDALPDIARHLDEPYGDLIVLPSWRLAKTAKRELTVVLTGDGADEIFGGYLHQKMMTRRAGAARLLGLPGIPALMARVADLIPAALLDKVFDYPDRLGPREKGKLIHALSRSGRFGSFYEGVTSCFTSTEKTALYTPEFRRLAPPADLAGEYEAALDERPEFPLLSRLGMMDLKYWLPFILLFRLDKLNMAHAVETRSPYLDYRLVQMALDMPDQFKLAGRSKEVLRRVHEQVFPPQLQVRGKQAFYMPFLDQHRHRLHHWLDNMLSQSAVESRGLFRWRQIEALRQGARAGSMLANRQLVALAMLEQWFLVYEGER